MSILSTPWLKRVALLVAALAVAWGVWRFTNKPVDDTLAQGNGRIQATEIDVAAKTAGRVDSILVNEGDLVKAGDVVAYMDRKSIEAQLNQAIAQAASERNSKEAALALVAQREADIAAAHAVFVQRQSELDLANKTNARTQTLYTKRALSAQEADETAARANNASASLSAARAQIMAAEAAVHAAKAQVDHAQAGIEAADAFVQRLRTELEDCVLRAPRAGRVQYRIVEPGEVVAGGGKVVSLVDLGDVYMTFFLPEVAAGHLAIGSEARVVLDAAPQYVIPAQVSYVASVAQFTPKAVETQSERQKMMFRVKARFDPELLSQYSEYVKTGLPGMAYVRTDANKAWPEKLQIRMPDVRK